MVVGSKMLGAGIATTALSGVGIGIGLIFHGLSEAAAKNPRMATKLFNWTVLGFALTEAIALFTMMITFLILF